MAGVICSSKDFINSVVDVNTGVCMLLGLVLDSLRSDSILKNLHSLHIRMEKHSANALYLAEHLHALGVTVHYPGLPHHPQHERMKKQMNPDFGFGGMLALDVKEKDVADRLMVAMQDAKIGYLAVSLGYFKTLFSAPASSTSSEIPEDRQKSMGLFEGMIRLSVGLDQDIARTFDRLQDCLARTGVIKESLGQALSVCMAAC